MITNIKKLFIKDLLNYSKEDLSILFRYNNINEQLPINVKVQKLAIKLMKTNKLKAEMNGKDEETLPFNGNIQEAMRAMSNYTRIPENQLTDEDKEQITTIRNAIRQIMNKKKKPIKETIVNLPIEARDCDNTIDIVSQDEWDKDNLPDLKINYLDPNNPFSTRSNLFCFKKNSIINWLSNPENLVSIWLPKIKDDYSNVDDQGYGSSPSSFNLFYKLPNNTYINDIHIFFDTKEIIAIPVAKKIRLGNKNGTFGIGQLHGQLPGETIYYLVSKDSDIKDKLISYFLMSIYNRQYILENINDIKGLEDIKEGFSKKYKNLNILKFSELDKTTQIEVFIFFIIYIYEKLLTMTKEKILDIIQNIWAKYPYIDIDYIDDKLNNNIEEDEYEYLMDDMDMDMDMDEEELEYNDLTDDYEIRRMEGIDLEQLNEARNELNTEDYIPLQYSRRQPTNLRYFNQQNQDQDQDEEVEID